jgi:hypothetical protein
MMTLKIVSGGVEDAINSIQRKKIDPINKSLGTWRGVLGPDTFVAVVLVLPSTRVGQGKRFAPWMKGSVAIPR